MAKSMTEQLREIRLRKANRSMAYQEMREDYVKSHAEEAKRVLGHTGELEEALPMRLRQLYYRMKDEYSLTRSMALPKNTKRSQQYWERVADACGATDPERYMRAQFAFFHKSFGRAPDLNQIATPAAIERAKEFTGNQQRKVIGNNIAADISLPDLFRRSEKQMRDLMRAQKMSRLEIYTNFVLTGMIQFPEAFTKADPAYTEAVELDKTDG